MEKIKELQIKSLEMAQYFVDFCEKHQLLCYLCGGGCIGAVRHKGFIPWDDDLDFFMPRSDYEKLKRLWHNAEHSRYKLQYPSKTYNDHNIFITLRDEETTLIKPYQQQLDIVHGIVLDIFPLDAYAPTPVKRKLQLFWALLFQLYGAQMVPENHGKAIHIIGKVMLSIIPFKSWRYSVWSFAEKQMSKYDLSDTDYITELCAGPKYMRKKYKKEYFEKAVFKDFDGKRFPIPVGYDGYLTEAFGDYMVLPPVDQQVPSHSAIVIDLEKPYKEYKGTMYLNK